MKPSPRPPLPCLLPAIALALVLIPNPAGATILWKGDFETGDLSQWDSTNLIKTGDRDNLVFVTDQVADGMKAAQITLRDDIIFEPYNQSRVEVKHEGLHTMNGEDSYYAWSFMVPGDAEIRSNIGYWESLVTFRNTMSFYIEPADGGGTDLVFGTGNLGETERWRQKLELNKWHRIAIHNHWSQQQADGKVNVWYDGQQVVTNVTATKYDANELFFQMGLHRSDPSPPVQVIYIDAAIETDSQLDLLEALPDPAGMGGAGGMGGPGGAAGAAGAGGLAGGTAGETGGGGAATGGGGSPGAAGAIASAGVATSGAGAVLPPVSGAAASNDSGGCGLAQRGAHGIHALLLLGFGWLLRGRRRAPRARPLCAARPAAATGTSARRRSGAADPSPAPRSPTGRRGCGSWHP